MVGTSISDPVFQMGIFGVVVGIIAVLLVLCAQVGTTYPAAVAQGTRLVLVFGVLGVLVLAGCSGWNAPAGQKGNAPASSPVVSSSPAGPTVEPTLEPSPTPTPHLSRSITQVLTTFCNEITARNYQAAWSLYAQRLQRRHSRAAVFAAWSHYQGCSVADQAGDPDAIAVLVFTLAPGIKDQYGFSGDTYIHFTMGIEAQAWKITAGCRQIAEGCYSLVWG